MTLFGLGNPTERYARTRHNLGFMVLDRLAAGFGARFRHLPGRMVARVTLAGRNTALVKPLLYMNESGIPVREQLSDSPDQFLVVCDDLALPFGRLRLRPGGSDGGHKGLASIIYHLGSSDFPRLRIGIDAPPRESDATEYVLEPFTDDEATQLPEVIDRASEACVAVVTDGLEAAMNQFNPKPEAEGEQPKEA